LPPAAFEGSGHGMRPITLSSPLDEGRCDRVAGQSHLDVGSPLPIRAMTFEIDARYNIFGWSTGAWQARLRQREGAAKPSLPVPPSILTVPLHRNASGQDMCFAVRQLPRTETSCAPPFTTRQVHASHCQVSEAQPHSKSSSSVTQTNAAQDLVHRCITAVH
jgi:hypothetical protein